MAGSLTVSSNPALIPATQPDDGSSVFPVVLVLDEAGSVNWEGGAAAFIDALEADYSDLQVTQADGETPVAFGVAQFSQVGGSRKLIIHLGVPTLNSAVATDYVLHCGVAGGPYENKAGVYPAADGWLIAAPLEEASGNRDNWPDDRTLSPQGDATQAAGKIGYGVYTGNSDDNYLLLSSITEAQLNVTFLVWANFPSMVYTNAKFVQRTGWDTWEYRRLKYDTREVRFVVGGVASGQVLGAPLGEWMMLVGRLRTPGINYPECADSQSLYYKADGSKTAGPVTNVGRTHGFRFMEQVVRCMYGTGDEVRAVARWLSDNWIETVHKADWSNDAFWTVGEFVSAAARYPAARRSRIYRLGPRLTQLGVI